MTARRWMQIAALTSALGLTGAAMADEADRTTVTDDGSSLSAMEAPSAGAIVTPEDKAFGLGRDESNRNGVANDETSADDIAVNPGTSNDDMSAVPGTTNDDMSIDPDRVDRDDAAAK